MIDISNMESDEFRLNIDAYSTEWGNRYLSFGGQDDAGDDVFYNFNDVTQIHTGIEFDFQYKPMAANGLAFNLFGSIGDWKYKDTTPYRRFDGETNQLEESGEVNLSDVKVGQAPQTSFGVGLDWDATDRLTLYSSFNYFDDFYGFVDVEDVIQADFKKLTSKLKKEFSVGGSYKKDNIIIQGDYRDKIMEILSGLGFNVKRVGG